MASSTFEDDVSFLIAQLDSTTSSARLLAYLILHSLVITLRGPRQLSTCLSILKYLSPRLAGHSLRDLKHADENVNTVYMESVYKKTEETRTTLRATVSILAAMSKVAKPSGQIVWLSGESKAKDASYKTFAQQIYLWANTVILPANVAQSLLRSLLTQLGEEALLFLSSVWTCSTSPAPLRTSALKHALAFIHAYATLPTSPAAQGQPVDFQVILPQILIALQDSDKDVRRVAVDVLRSVEGGEGMGDVYALDTVYGYRSGKLVLRHLSLWEEF